ncbi:Imm50 family immunity protein [Streptomyces sp. NPDC004009]
MGASEWRRLLGDAHLLGGLYEGRPPTPDECELFYVHADERGDSVTVGFDTRRLPSCPDTAWGDVTYNRFEFYLSFFDVADLRVTGWGAREARSVDLAASPGGAIRVSSGDAGSGIHFTASSMRLAHARVYLASEVP